MQGPTFGGTFEPCVGRGGRGAPDRFVEDQQPRFGGFEVQFEPRPRVGQQCALARHRIPQPHAPSAQVDIEFGVERISFRKAVIGEEEDVEIARLVVVLIDERLRIVDADGGCQSVFLLQLPCTSR